MSFDPYNLDSSASLNRVFIADLPGFQLPDWVRGQTAFDLLSATAIAARARDRLGISASSDAEALHLFSSQLETNQAAQHLALELGEALGIVLAVLKRGDAINRAARAEWTPHHWAHWASIERVWLGGGIASGFGAFLERGARGFLGRAGIPLELHCAEHPSELPLIGAARSLNSAQSIALDFGNTHVKIARLERERLYILPALEAPVLFALEPAALTERMLQLVANIARELGSSEIVSSIACYLRDGQAISYGAYPEALRRFSQAETGFSEQLSQRLERPIKLRFLHDGTSAARAVPTTPRTAVIMLGTALGVGFVNPALHLNALEVYNSV